MCTCGTGLSRLGRGSTRTAMAKLLPSARNPNAERLRTPCDRCYPRTPRLQWRVARPQRAAARHRPHTYTQPTRRNRNARRAGVVIVIRRGRTHRGVMLSLQGRTLQGVKLPQFSLRDKTQAGANRAGRTLDGQTLSDRTLRVIPTGQILGASNLTGPTLGVNLIGQILDATHLIGRTHHHERRIRTWRTTTMLRCLLFPDKRGTRRAVRAQTTTMQAIWSIPQGRIASGGDTFSSRLLDGWFSLRSTITDLTSLSGFSLAYDVFFYSFILTSAAYIAMRHHIARGLRPVWVEVLENTFYLPSSFFTFSYVS